MAEEVLVKVENLSKKFCKDLKTSLWYGLQDLLPGRHKDREETRLRPKEFWALKDINFELRRGECLGLIGHNGAGKSTLLKILNGLINPDAGQVTMRGRVGALIELGAGFNPILTGRENIYNSGAVLGFTRKEINEKIEAIIDFAEIRDFIDMPVQNYSSGMKVRLGFSVAAQMEPDVLIIDEVLAVGDIGFRHKCINAIGDLMKNAAVIFVSHAMPMIYRVCNQIMLMDRGACVFRSNNLGKGIDKYYQIFPDSGQKIIGTQEAQIVDFKCFVNDERLEEANNKTILHGSKVTFALQIKIDRTIEKAMIQLVIWNQEMLPIIDVIGPNFDGCIINNKQNIHNLEVTIPSLELNSGKHAVSLHVNTPDLKRNLLRYDNALIFNMKCVSASGAHVLLPLPWNVD